MSAQLTLIRRHPIKGIGYEALKRTALATDRPLPGDRAWAVMTGDTTDSGTWQPRRHFAQCASAPALMATQLRVEGQDVVLHHPERPTLRFDPAQGGDPLIDWLAPLWPAHRPAPTALIRAPEQGMSDANYASVSLMNLNSLRALSDATGGPIDPSRFRGNLWVDGLPAWAETGWVGQELRIGTARLRVVEPIVRCRAIEADPATGLRAPGLLRTLAGFDPDQVFGINLAVIAPGEIATGDRVELAP